MISLSSHDPIYIILVEISLSLSLSLCLSVRHWQVSVRPLGVPGMTRHCWTDSSSEMFASIATSSTKLQHSFTSLQVHCGSTWDIKSTQFNRTLPIQGLLCSQSKHSLLWTTDSAWIQRYEFLFFHSSQIRFLPLMSAFLSWSLCGGLVPWLRWRGYRSGSLSSLLTWPVFWG